ncbi:AEC family transporter [Flavobacterium silvaticum]|uniref:AEC family transporter n=1 Tax=Flavobacterium silvaticum TaxID=1852020 RepID=A0A972G2K1_9FLAO|nr:AEC family transporter [Flavobacterium silvaticum]NMH29301.1 AEC family transporter [Flavobacterium silvaticum]
MDSILLLFLCLISGVILRRFKTFPPNAHLVLNQFVIYFSLPAVALYYIPKIRISSELLYPLGVGWLSFALSFAFFFLIGKWLGFSKKLTGCLVLMCGLGNTSFVGFPIIEALYGKEGLKTAIIVDQPGSFMVMATLGILVASVYSSGNVSWNAVGSRILKFPPFLAFVVGLTLNILSVDFPEIFQSAFQKLGNTVSPLALVAVGLQLNIQRRSSHWGVLSLGLVFKLMLMPLFFYLLYYKICGGTGQTIGVSVIESAMAPMITAGVLCHQYGLKPKLASMMLGIGIPLSLLTVAFWYFLIG